MTTRRLVTSTLLAVSLAGGFVCCAGAGVIGGCTVGASETNAPPIDLDKGLDGAETTIEKWTGCKPGGHVELWTIAGGAHIPTLSAEFTPDMVDFLYAHPKP